MGTKINKHGCRGYCSIYLSPLGRILTPLLLSFPSYKHIEDGICWGTWNRPHRSPCLIHQIKVIWWWHGSAFYDSWKKSCEVPTAQHNSNSPAEPQQAHIAAGSFPSANHDTEVQRARYFSDPSLELTSSGQAQPPEAAPILEKCKTRTVQADAGVFHSGCFRLLEAFDFRNLNSCHKDT